tara:strand:- start:861 stop:1316 length:456 start_codon:yes stop_codon:yes gene_type:complete
MGHWAEIDENNIVLRVIVIKEAELDTGNWGDKSKWIKTSYNTRNGIHYVPNASKDQVSPDQSKALRYRFACKGMKYDAENDVFYYPTCQLESHIFSTEVWDWIPPISKPADAAKNAEEQQSGKKVYYWDEDVYQADTGNPKTKGWVEIPEA